jgi:DNA repair exonuclease SbcCD ATPase subunit
MSREHLNFEIEEALETIENDLVIPEQGSDHAPLLAKIYDLPDRVIDDLKEKYLPLKILGAVDKQGRAVVHNALMDVKSYISAIDKTRLKTNEKAQAWIKVNNGEAKRLSAKLEPIRDHLQAERDQHDKEVEEIKAAKQKEQDEKNQARVNALLAVGSPISIAEVVLMTEPVFKDYLATKTLAFEEAKRIAAEAEAKAKAEAEAQAEAKAKADKEAAEKLEAERLANAKAKAENDRIAAELKAKMDEFNTQQAQAAAVAQAEQARKDAEAKAKAITEKNRLEDEARAEQKAKDEADRLEAEKAKAAAIEAAKPDAEKLEGFAHFLEGKAPPELDTDAGKAVQELVKKAHAAYCKFIRTQAATLTK